MSTLCTADGILPSPVHFVYESDAALEGGLRGDILAALRLLRRCLKIKGTGALALATRCLYHKHSSYENLPPGFPFGMVDVWLCIVLDCIICTTVHNL